MESPTFAAQVSGVAALDNDLTRATYRLALAETWVSRDRASEVLQVARSVAAFHLDKLVEAGLLQARFARPPGRSGPGAGRPAKLYGRSALEIDLSLPARRYALAGAVLADAVVRSGSDGLDVTQSVSAAAHDTGLALGSAGGVPTRAPRSARARLTGLAALLSEHGYEAQAGKDEVALYNCPFHTLAERHRGLVCGMNLALLTGVVEGAGAQDDVCAVLAPEPGMCCVRLRRQGPG
jgi:predicted ArsR family transcriptional regulator